MNRTVTLTDQSGAAIGTADLLAAHTGEGLLHKAFSVYVFNAKKTAMLIQRRSDKKMLWPLFWANTCCSHPLEDETPVAAGERRLQQELGVTTQLTEGQSFVYRALDPAGRGVEHEHVTILLGTLDEKTPMMPNADEVSACRWIDLDALRSDMQEHPEVYAPWFHIGLANIL